MATKTLRKTTHTVKTTVISSFGDRFFHGTSIVFAYQLDGEEDFIKATADKPAESRIFVHDRYGTSPMLIVKGSMKSLPSDEAYEVLVAEV